MFVESRIGSFSYADSVHDSTRELYSGVRPSSELSWRSSRDNLLTRINRSVFSFSVFASARETFKLPTVRLNRR